MVPCSLLSPETVLRGAIKTVGSKVGLVGEFVSPLPDRGLCLCTSGTDTCRRGQMTNLRHYPTAAPHLTTPLPTSLFTPCTPSHHLPTVPLLNPHLTSLLIPLTPPHPSNLPEPNQWKYFAHTTLGLMFNWACQGGRRGGEDGNDFFQLFYKHTTLVYIVKTRGECTCLGSCQPVECRQPYHPHGLPQDPAKKLVLIQKICGLVVHLVGG